MSTKYIHCSNFIAIEFYSKSMGFFGYIICIQLGLHCLKEVYILTKKKRRFILYVISTIVLVTAEPDFHSHTCLDKAWISADELAPPDPPFDLDCLGTTLREKSKKENSKGWEKNKQSNMEKHQEKMQNNLGTKMRISRPEEVLFKLNVSPEPELFIAFVCSDFELLNVLTFRSFPPLTLRSTGL